MCRIVFQFDIKSIQLKVACTWIKYDCDEYEMNEREGERWEESAKAP